jgi:hypothetical protein
VVEASLGVDRPAFAGRQLHRLTADLRLQDRQLTVDGARLWTLAEGLPITLDGAITLQPEDLRRSTLGMHLTLPRQSLAMVRPLIPVVPAMQGEIAGHLHVDGTLASPQVREGDLTVAGAVTLPEWDTAYPNYLGDIDIRLRVAREGTAQRLTVARGSATLDRREGDRRPSSFKPGWLATEGSVLVPRDAWSDLDRWQWDLHAKIIRLPLQPKLFLVPQLSGFLRLHHDGQGPVLQGVLLAEHAKIKEPKLEPGQAWNWDFGGLNPRLSVVLQVGENVRLAKSILRFPLRNTPLPRPEVPAVIPGVLPSLEIDPDDRVYDYNAEMLAIGVAGEMSGTWGAITGTLEDPRLYARFEVDKSRLKFPLNLISSIRKARGHVTYTKAEGPRIIMGIPEFPTTAEASTAEQAKGLAAETPAAE